MASEHCPKAIFTVLLSTVVVLTYVLPYFAMYALIPSTWSVTMASRPSSDNSQATSSLLSWNRFSVRQAAHRVPRTTARLPSLSQSPSVMSVRILVPFGRYFSAASYRQSASLSPMVCPLLVHASHPRAVCHLLSFGGAALLWMLTNTTFLAPNRSHQALTRLTRSPNLMSPSSGTVFSAS